MIRVPCDVSVMPLLNLKMLTGEASLRHSSKVAPPSELRRTDPDRHTKTVLVLETKIERMRAGNSPMGIKVFSPSSEDRQPKEIPSSFTNRTLQSCNDLVARSPSSRACVSMSPLNSKSVGEALLRISGVRSLNLR